MKPLPATLVVCASVVLSVLASLAVGSRSEGAASPTAVPPDTTAARIDKLEARIAALEERPESLRADVPMHESGSVAPERTPVDADAIGPRIAALEQRLAALDRRQPQRQSSPRPARSPEEEARWRAQRDAEVRQVIEAATNTILDPRASVQAKVEAHKTLRYVENAYTPAMVQELLRLATLDPEPSVRASTWTSFDGQTRLPELVQPLLNALANDPDAGPRNEASETLGNYADYPGVLEALRHAAKHDPSLEVRGKALRTLREVDPDHR